ncbi:MAG: flagellar basal body L-ring protein FlgH [Planctomycetes bacterium]|nr:flagellar basal body L-ring protein FlgH [Planctomycetota bacterium]
MRPSVYLLLAGLLAAGATVPQARADSIWAKAQGRNGQNVVRVYEDEKAGRLGDVLTIIINEHSVIENETTREMDKAIQRAAAMSGNLNLRDVGQWYGNRNASFTLPDVAATSSGSSQFSGSADYETDRLITDRVTVVVRDVLPNGNLLVLGTRQRHVDGDVQVIEIGGVVRPSDITFANTVRSDQVADFRMVAKVKGPEKHWTKPGWLGRLFNWLSPW